MALFICMLAESFYLDGMINWQRHVLSLKEGKLMDILSSELGLSLKSKL